MACRVEMRDLSPNASWHEMKNANEKLVRIFRKSVSEAGIVHECKQRRFYESPSEKKRRKKKESENQRLKARLRENFSGRANNEQ
jgi:small subunit ribosomal protein S21